MLHFTNIINVFVYYSVYKCFGAGLQILRSWNIVFLCAVELQILRSGVHLNKYNKSCLIIPKDYKSFGAGILFFLCAIKLQILRSGGYKSLGTGTLFFLCAVELQILRSGVHLNKYNKSCLIIPKDYKSFGAGFVCYYQRFKGYYLR